ncbi:MAG: nucleoside-diphosphate kinase [Dehalococcoidia bacterium]
MAERERTLVLAKPDAMQRGLAGEIVRRLEQRGLKIVGMKLMRIDEALAKRHYAEHEGKPFFASLVEYITSAPVLAMVFDGPSAIQAVRGTVGSTNPAEATPGSIRGDFALERGKNLVHASDSVESGQRETALFFKPEEILGWERDSDPWIHE